MGSIRAQEMAAAVDDGVIDLHTALVDHLQVNHFPPVPPPFIATAVEAIERANNGEWGLHSDLPERTREARVRDHRGPASGALYRHGGSTSMTEEFTVSQERAESIPGRVDAFVVRDKRTNFLASFAYRFDAELFATLLGCDSCKEDVSAHTALTKRVLEETAQRLDHPSF